MPEQTKQQADVGNNAAALFSPEVTEIISYRPSWIIRNGITLLLLMLSAFIALSFFINFPDMIIAKATFVTDSTSKSKHLAKLEIPQANFSKVKIGQQVILKIASYPSADFGVIRSTIDTVYAITPNAICIAKINLPDSLMTSYHRYLPFSNGLTAEANIITSETKLSDKIFQGLKHIFH